MGAEDRTILEIARGYASEEEQLFDELGRGLATGTISRRRALKLAGAAILGSTGLLSLFPGYAAAQTIVGGSDRSVTVAAGDRQCRGEPAINNRRCPNTGCGGNPDCRCVENVDGEKKCVSFRDEACPSRDQCDRHRDCARGDICVKVGGCCGRARRNLCARPCS